jgi:hypothetical protein
MRTRVISTFLAGAALTLGVAAPAQAHRLVLQPLHAVALQTTAEVMAPAVRDAVIRRPVNQAAARTVVAHAAKARFKTRDGITIPVQVSSAYRASAAVQQGYVNFLGTLIHGPELRNLRVFVASPKQIQGALCGAGALACYDGDNQTMYVPGANQNSNPPLQFLIAHEYGHHIELSRSNAPWSAYDTGAKNWFTYEQICSRTRERRVATNYWNDPSEAFAESYADAQFPGIAFPYGELMTPDMGAFEAIRQDVLHPWTGSHTVPLAGTLGAGAPDTQSFQVSAPLDGSASFNLTPSGKADYRLQVLSGTKVLTRGARGATSIHTLCGVRTLTLQVTRVSGSGPFTLSVSLP